MSGAGGCSGLVSLRKLASLHVPCAASLQSNPGVTCPLGDALFRASSVPVSLNVAVKALFFALSFPGVHKKICAVSVLSDRTDVVLAEKPPTVIR